MNYWMCATCGTQFQLSEEAPSHCPICEDQRQYIGHQGQQWTSIETLQSQGYKNTIREHEQNLLGIGTEPRFAIGQRALLIRSDAGNVLWDCISLLDDETEAAVRALGGLRAIAISHPHYYSSMVAWAEKFNAQIYLHEADRQWVMRPDERITFWSGETLTLQQDITLIRLGGHFAGGTVLHWKPGAEGQGALLSGDIIYVVADRQWVSFMYSFPNLIPLPASEVARIRDTIAAYDFARIYAAWFETIVPRDGKEAVIRSANRYIAALAGKL
ncbi:MAG TPA: MBL fold metallo-hydrolase [Ktedonobacteraceae bacterium]|nr:MBL fold metallo-hydrolase [Ktedonobacteraceae bacterium]